MISLVQVDVPDSVTYYGRWGSTNRFCSQIGAILTNLTQLYTTIIIYLRQGSTVEPDRLMFVNNGYVYKKVKNRIAKGIKHDLGPDLCPDFASQAALGF